MPLLVVQLPQGEVFAGRLDDGLVIYRVAVVRKRACLEKMDTNSGGFDVV